MNIDNLDINSIATLVSCFLSAYFGFKISSYSTKNPLKIEVYKKQLKFVYAPLFKEIQPHIYKQTSTKVALRLVSKFNKIKRRNFELIDPNLISNFFQFENDLKMHKVSFSTFYEICYLIDSNFECLRKSLFLPFRSFIYRYRNNERPNKLVSFYNLKFFFNACNIYLLCLFLGIFTFLLVNAFLYLVEYLQILIQ